MKNDIGKKFGKFTAIEDEEDKGGYNSRYICECDCGNTHSVSKSHLRSGLITHCGCVRHEGTIHQQWKGVGEISGDFWYNHVVRSANGDMFKNGKRKPKELCLTIQEAWDLFLKQNRKCALSGTNLNFPKRSKDKFYNASLDRIDSSKGYIEGNVQWVHKDINIMKNKFGNQYFIDMCKEICIFQIKEETINSNIPLHEQGIDILNNIQTDGWLQL